MSVHALYLSKHPQSNEETARGKRNIKRPRFEVAPARAAFNSRLNNVRTVREHLHVETGTYLPIAVSLFLDGLAERTKRGARALSPRDSSFTSKKDPVLSRNRSAFETLDSFRHDLFTRRYSSGEPVNRKLVRFDP